MEVKQGTHLIYELNASQKAALEQAISNSVGIRDVDIEHVRVAGDGYHYKATYVAGSPWAVRHVLHFKAVFTPDGVTEFERV